MQKSKSAEERAANKQLNTDLISLVVFIKISISMVVVVVTKISITNFFTIFFQSGEYQLCLGQKFQKVENDENRFFAITSSKLFKN